MTHVVVEQPIGSWSCSRANADEPEPGRLVVRGVDDGHLIRTFQSEHWLRCEVRDEQGVVFWFRNERPVDAMNAVRR